jgi:hypothetical protein
MRYTIPFLIAVLLPSPVEAHEHRQAKCTYQDIDPAVWTVPEVKATIRCAVEKFPVSSATAHYIAYRESRYRATALNSSSGACGVYQFIPSTWNDISLRYSRWKKRWNLGDGCTNARTNVLFAIRYAHQIGWGPWAI